MIATLFGLIGDWGQLGGLVSGAVSLAGTALEGWKKWALIALGFAALGVVILTQHEIHRADKAEIAAWQAKFNEQNAANIGLADQVKTLTADRAAADAAAATAAKQLAARESAALTTVTEIQKEIVHVAVPSDDVESPALRAALERLRR